MNESDLNKVSAEYKDVFHTIQEYCLFFLPNEVQSIYIRGFVPRGLGIEGVSLDTFGRWMIQEAGN